MDKVLATYRRFGCSSRTKSVWSPPCRIAVRDKASTRECLFVHRQQGLLLFVYVDDIKMVGKSRPWSRCGPMLIKCVEGHSATEDVPTLLKLPMSQVQIFGFGYLTQVAKNRAKHSRNCGSLKEMSRTPLAGVLCERQFEKVLIENGWEKSPTWECLFVHHQMGVLLSVYVGDMKMTRKNIIWKPRGKD